MRAPASTYRVQVTSEFDLYRAGELCAYLAALGVGAVYCSPVLQAVPGSNHGYDVTDHDHIDAGRGGEAGWRSFVAAARAHGLDIVVDIVPNHMGVAAAWLNTAWWDVLRLGPQSPFASWFDIEWTRSPLLLPVLGDEVDLSTELKVDGRELVYSDVRFPIAPGTEGGAPEAVLARQHYALVNFRRADTEQNYRRFFAVTTLAGLRIEDETVAHATHREILRWVTAAEVIGLRIDHPDGLADPGGYLAWLREHAPDAWITVEKILEPGEALPDWPVAGTTGYDALAEVNQVFIDPAAEPAMTTLYQELTGDTATAYDHVQAGKREIATSILRAEVLRLERLIPAQGDAAVALTELLVAFETYRSYLPAEADRLVDALRLARSRRPELTSTFDALEPRLSDPADELCVRFQQTSGAVMAKGVEDTAYYRYTRFVALNEVGGDPGQFGATPEQFHAAQNARHARTPMGMTTLSTHDTKRGEDVRARLAVLAEVPNDWHSLVQSLMATAPLPNRRFAYLLWQTFVGVGFIDRARMHGYAEKAMREAREETGWTDPEPMYEAAVHVAVERAYDDELLRDQLEQFLARITPAARSNSLAQKLVQLTMPGVADTYQGCELWDDNLVDPDNRRSVDFDARVALLTRLDAAGSPPPLDDAGAAKLWLVSRALRVRRDRPELFSSYAAVAVVGPAADHVLAFDRGGAITVVTRLPVGLRRRGGFGSTEFELAGVYSDALTGARYRDRAAVRDVLAVYPVGLLVRD